MKISIKKLFIFLFFFFILLSIFYENFYKKTFHLNIDLPTGENYTLSFSNLDLLKMSIYGILRNINVNLNNTEKVRRYAKEINKLIAENKEYYNFYYLKFQKFYPKRYFIFCVEDSCDTFFFSISGLINVNNTQTNDLLIVWVDEKYLEKMLELIKNRDRKVLEYLREGIIKGYFKVTNANILIENILKEYKT